MRRSIRLPVWVLPTPDKVISLNWSLMKLCFSCHYQLKPAVTSWCKNDIICAVFFFLQYCSQLHYPQWFESPQPICKILFCKLKTKQCIYVDINIPRARKNVNADALWQIFASFTKGICCNLSGMKEKHSWGLWKPFFMIRFLRQDRKSHGKQSFISGL